MRCKSGFHCVFFFHVGDKKVQRADQDPDGFGHSEEETVVKGWWMLH